MVRSYELGVLFLPSAFVSPRGRLTGRERSGRGGGSSCWAVSEGGGVPAPFFGLPRWL